MKIISASKKSQSLSDATSSIFVINREDIRRSGMRSLPELLRMVPGLHVAQIDASKWAISSRGFNGRFSNKLLVLMDGRTIYTPLFSGVYWDMQDTPLSDIERIEVIRGPGGTLWGANAVNGVINIITRHSEDTTGTSVNVYGERQQQGMTLRHGAQLSDQAWSRVYAKAKQIDDADDAHDAWDVSQIGFRADWMDDHANTFKIQGDAFEGDADQSAGVTTLPPPFGSTAFVEDTVDMRGFNLLFQWKHQTADDGEWQLQAYVDESERDEIVLGQKIRTYDLEFQHRTPVTASHEVTWGLGYRRIEDELRNTDTVIFTPSSDEKDLFSAFIQDVIRLDENLSLTLGSKFEHNDFTGFEYQPSAKILWRVSDDDNVWASVSRAVRTPSRTDSDIQINYLAFGPFVFSSVGDKSFDSEELTAFELGYRGVINPNASIDVALFYNDYDQLSSNNANPITRITTIENEIEGESYGLELSLNQQVTPDWRLAWGYAYFRVDVRTKSGFNDPGEVSEIENETPEHQLQLRSFYNISDTVELDAALYYTDQYSVSSFTTLMDMPERLRLDLRLGWQVADGVKLAVGGRNLLDDRHFEYTQPDVAASEVERSFYGEIALEF